MVGMPGMKWAAPCIRDFPEDTKGDPRGHGPCLTMIEESFQEAPPCVKKELEAIGHEGKLRERDCRIV
jgi:hypothetical protein